MSHCGLNSLSCEILGQILECAGVLALHELFKCGDAVLSAKLGSERGVSCYRNVDEYDHEVMWSKYVLNQLRGLRHLALRHDPRQGASSLPKSLYSLGLPIEQIEVLEMRAIDDYSSPSNAVTRKRFETWFEEDIFFPRLHTLIVHANHCYSSKLRVIRPISVESSKGIYAPHISHLEIEDNVMFAFPLPRCLHSLTISWEQVRGLAWLKEFPNLSVLRLPKLKNWVLVSEEKAPEVFSIVPNSITHLSITDPCGRISSDLSAFLFHFKGVEILDTPWLLLEEENIKRLPYLKIVNCSINKAFNFPSSIKKATLKIVTDEKLAYIPGCAVELETHRMVESDFFLLPPTVSRLQVDCFQESILEALPSTMRTLIVGSTVYVRTVNIRCSIRQTGWTTRMLAAKLCDFDGLEVALKSSSPEDTMAGKWIVEECQRSDNHSHHVHQGVRGIKSNRFWILPLDTLEWLRMRGLLSLPASVGSLRCSYLFDLPLKEYRKTLKWAKDKLSHFDWHQTLSNLNKRTHSDLHILAWFQEDLKESIGSIPKGAQNALTTAVLHNQPLTANCLLKKGFRTLELFPLLSTGLGVPDWVKTLFRNPNLKYTFQSNTISLRDLIHVLKRHTERTFQPMNVLIAQLLLQQLHLDPSEPVCDGGTPLYISDLVLVQVSGSLVGEWVESVHWMLDHDVPFKHVGYPSWSSIVHLVAPHAEESLIRKLVQKGFDLLERGGVGQRTGLEMMTPSCRLAAEKMLSQNPGIPKTRSAGIQLASRSNGRRKLQE